MDNNEKRSHCVPKPPPKSRFNDDESSAVFRLLLKQEKILKDRENNPALKLTPEKSIRCLPPVANGMESNQEENKINGKGENDVILSSKQQSLLLARPASIGGIFRSPKLARVKDRPKGSYGCRQLKHKQTTEQQYDQQQLTQHGQQEQQQLTQHEKHEKQEQQQLTQHDKPEQQGNIRIQDIRQEQQQQRLVNTGEEKRQTHQQQENELQNQILQCREQQQKPQLQQHQEQEQQEQRSKQRQQMHTQSKSFNEWEMKRSYQETIARLKEQTQRFGGRRSLTRTRSCPAPSRSLETHIPPISSNKTWTESTIAESMNKFTWRNTQFPK